MPGEIAGRLGACDSPSPGDGPAAARWELDAAERAAGYPRASRTIRKPALAGHRFPNRPPSESELSAASDLERR